MTSSAQAVPRFAGRIQVDQTASGLALSGFLATGLLGALPGVSLGVLALAADPDATGWRALVSTVGMLGGMALAIVGMFAGMMYWFVLEQRWLAWRGKLPFSAVARVEIDERGLAVEGLGQLGWGEVLSWEGVPDSDSALIVHTQRHGGLLLHAAVDELIPPLAHFLAASSGAAGKAGGELVWRFTAQVFSWPRFMLWIVAGYAAAFAVAALLIIAGPTGEPFKTLLVLIVEMPICAWLVWSIALARLSLFGNRHVRAFELRGHVLHMGDGSWQADLRTSRVLYRSKRGVGYALTFLTVLPAKGRRLDLLTDIPEHDALLGHLRALAVLGPDPAIPDHEREHPGGDMSR